MQLQALLMVLFCMMAGAFCHFVWRKSEDKIRAMRAARQREPEPQISALLVDRAGATVATLTVRGMPHHVAVPVLDRGGRFGERMYDVEKIVYQERGLMN